MSESIPPRGRSNLLSRIPDQWAYMIPMFLFLGLLQVGATWPALYPASYVARVIVTTLALFLLWPKFTRIRWDFWWMGVIVGVLGIVQWVWMQTFLEQFAWFKPDEDAFNPFKHFDGTPQLAWSFIAVRIIGAVLVVPVMEELFWRDWLWRTILAPNDFKLAQVGEFEWPAFLGVAGAFALVHLPWWPTAIVWALMIGALLIYTKSLGACILAHAVTNLLLALYVLKTHAWHLW